MRYGLYGSLAILIAGFTGLGILLAPPVTLSPAAEKPEATKEVRNTAEIEGQRTRGAYLARIGNCLGCHTAYSGLPYAGGHILDTSIGIFITPNITSDKETGIGPGARKISGGLSITAGGAMEISFIRHSRIRNIPGYRAKIRMPSLPTFNHFHP